MQILDILLLITGGAAIGFYAGLEYMRSKILDGSLRSLIVDKIDCYYVGVYDLELSIREIEKEINARIEASRRKKERRCSDRCREDKKIIVSTVILISV